jgi:uncharacterized protein YgfB (UPF0149 family)
MMSDSAQGYVELRNTLKAVGAAADPAEFHGGLCASLCAAGRRRAQAWIEECVPDREDTHDTGKQARAALCKLEEHTWHILASSEMRWQPLLPDDDAPLEERVAALAAWCHGFLVGIGLAPFAPASQGRFSVEVDEILRDFAEISKAGLGGTAPADTSDGDFQFAELVEYVRVATQIMFEGLKPQRQNGRALGLD